MREIDYGLFYVRMVQLIDQAQSFFNRPLTLTEKILAMHCLDLQKQEWVRGESVLNLSVDRIALQDATAQMALLQFMQSKKGQVAVPTTVHCDHLIRAEGGSAHDLVSALQENQEVYNFLRSASSKHGIGFWNPGAGIIHQVVLENHAHPGGLMIGTDSHTPNAGGLAMLAIGAGGADAAEVMAGRPWSVLNPKIVGVHLTGVLSGWASAKDVITKLCTILTVKGGTNKVIEYFGPGVASISATGRATICNMGAELGATTSIFPCDERTVQYLQATHRTEIISQLNPGLLTADSEVFNDPGKFFDEVIEINLDELEPWVVGPHSPDRGRALSVLAAEAEREGWPPSISHALIGSCTNSSYEDMTRAVSVVQQALDSGMTLQTPLLVTPGSNQVYELMKQKGMVRVFEQAGAKVLSNACGPCIGMWKRSDVGPGTANVIVSSYNRNFPARNDGNEQTLSFITSPEVVVALAFAGRFESVLGFEAPKGYDLPVDGFPKGRPGFEEPSHDSASVQIVVAENSERLQLLEPFTAWDGNDFLGLPILLKAQGKTTTDSISPAGIWLAYRGHLDRISANMFLGALNAFTNERGKTINPLTGEKDLTPAAAARYLKAMNQSWVVVGDENYGEGSSREHAAMSPRHLGCVAVIVRSFARIHETNLKKQGILPLTFSNPDDYDKIGASDRISIVGLNQLAPGSTVTVMLQYGEAEISTFTANHSMTTEQIEWFRAGSAMNLV